MNVLTTSRLNIRHIELSDADFIMELYNTPGWIKYVGDRGVTSEENAEEYLNSRIIPLYEKLGYGFYLVERLSDQKRIGICGIVKREGLDDVDIGYGFLPEYHGKGFAIEAAQACLDHGFTDHKIKRIVAITLEGNHSSIALLKKLGMTYEKMIKLPDDDAELMLFGIDSNDKLG